ncbi:glucan synthase-like 1 [Actinidia rufa]|uniref:Glucan synthase-like 1 n=1 Tax=Actinidia rufa TaxID=165716 RepID=A0A7J0EXV0_9ERIC|nr:glucan synthase-like 1 [Actinidia rufa]
MASSRVTSVEKQWVYIPLQPPRLRTPPPRTPQFFCHSSRDKRVGKTGFVEQRMFWNVFRSFDRVAYVDEVHFGREEIGERKPGNQNHAIIFTRGDAVQTIVMNQDNCFEEALKMRNLLDEFKKHYGIRKPTILGRVLANPLKVRMHYGHPDVFDRFWFLIRSGISKASRVINIRYVGLNQISMFEAKVSSGNGEQVLSRDVYRLGHRLDFFHMLSFYFTSVYAFCVGRLYLAFSGVEREAKGRASSGNNDALGTIINQQFIIQNGLFTALRMIVENSLEHCSFMQFGIF